MHTKRLLQKNFVVVGKILNNSLALFKIPWMLFEKRIPIAYFDLTICHSIQAKYKGRYVCNIK